MKKTKIIFIMLLSLNVAFMKNAISSEEHKLFTLDEICKAGLSTVYGRSIDIMKSQSISDKVTRITYVRSQDGAHLSYLCRKESMSRLGILDERLNGARWYGSDLADSQIFYSTINNVLTIKDVNNGEVLKSNIYTKKDFISSKSSEKKNDAVAEWLEQYSNKKTKTSKEWRVKYIDTIHTSTTPVNAYMIRFNTSDKKLFSLPNAKNDPVAYDKNILRITKWTDYFCTEELSDFMKENRIGLLPSEISHNGEVQFIGTCFPSR